MSILYSNITVCFELETVDKYFCTDPIPSVPVFNCQIPTSLHSPCTKHQFSVLSSHNAFHTLPNILLERMDPQHYHHVEECNPLMVVYATTPSKICFCLKSCKSKDHAEEYFKYFIQYVYEYSEVEDSKCSYCFNLALLLHDDHLTTIYIKWQRLLNTDSFP